MTLPARDGARNWVGRTVVDRNGADIGVCAALLTDTATGQPEWMFVERDEVTLVVPLLDARESGGRVHVTVTRAYADGAPRFAPTEELSRDQEAALYRHYGIEYSAESSDSLLPAEAHPADAEGAGSAPDAAVHQPTTSGAARRGGAVAAGVAVLAGLVAAVVAAVRLRRAPGLGYRRFRRRGAPPPRPAARRLLTVPTAARARALQVAAAAGPVLEASGRLARGAASAGTASLHRAAVGTARRGRAVSTVGRTYTRVAATKLAPLLATTGDGAWRVVRAAPELALRVGDAATDAVVAVVPRVAAGTARAGRTGLRAVLTVGAAAEAVPDVVAETGERLEKGWRSAMGKLSLGLGFGIGYVLGARAGRARYEQIKEAAAGFVERPEVQQALERARDVAPAPLQGGIDKLSGRGAGGQGAGGGTTGSAGSGGEDPAGTPPTPGSGTGRSSGTDAPLPDPLLPPARSADDPLAGP